MARRFAKVWEEEIVAINETSFFYPSDLVNTKTTLPLRVGEERWIYTSALRVSVYIHHYSPSLRWIVVYYLLVLFHFKLVKFNEESKNYLGSTEREFDGKDRGNTCDRHLRQRRQRHWGWASTYYRFAGTTSVPQTLITYQSSKSLHTLESSTNCAMARTKTGKSMICGKKKDLPVNPLKLYLLADISSLNTTLPLNNIYLPVDQHHSLLRTVEE